MSQVSLDVVVQTTARSINLEDTDELFEDDPTPDVEGDGEAPQDKQVKSIGDENHPVKEAKPANQENVMDEEASVDQP